MLAEFIRIVSEINAVSVCNVPSLAWVRLTEISKTGRITFKGGGAVLADGCSLPSSGLLNEHHISHPQ